VPVPEVVGGVVLEHPITNNELNTVTAEIPINLFM
jgi:hypothetical protein